MTERDDALRTYTTKSGKVLTDADIERLADEAERGYDVSRLSKQSSSQARQHAERVLKIWASGVQVPFLAWQSAAIVAEAYIALVTEIETLREAMQAADETLAGMWSFNDDSRESLAHTYPVKASDILRDALGRSTARKGEEDEATTGEAPVV